MKKKRGACGAWQWKEPEQLEWKEDNTFGKNLNLILQIGGAFNCQMLTVISSSLFI